MGNCGLAPNSRHWDRILAEADRIETITRADIAMNLDDTAVNSIKSSDTRGGSPRFIAA